MLYPQIGLPTPSGGTVSREEYNCEAAGITGIVDWAVGPLEDLGCRAIEVARVFGLF